MVKEGGKGESSDSLPFPDSRMLVWHLPKLSLDTGKEKLLSNWTGTTMAWRVGWGGKSSLLSYYVGSMRRVDFLISREWSILVRREVLGRESLGGTITARRGVLWKHEQLAQLFKLLGVLGVEQPLGGHGAAGAGREGLHKERESTAT